MIAHLPVDLVPHLNALAATHDDERHLGVTNAWGNSFPAEELPFGHAVVVGGLSFYLPAKRPGCYDHVEALGQEVSLPPADHMCGVALLCFGEMGPQRLDVELRDGRRCLRSAVTAPGWLVGTDSAGPQGLCCSHLHYPGCYELDRLHPCLWAVVWPVEASSAGAVLRFGSNPLFHFMAATLLVEGGHG